MVTRLEATGKETQVEALIRQVTALAEDLAGRYLWYRAFQYVVEGDGDDRIYVPVRPIVAVSSVRRGDDDPLEEGTDSDNEFEVWKDQGILELPSLWDTGRPYWKIDFTAGWWVRSMGDPTDEPKLEDERPDVERAIEEMVTLQWQIDSSDRTIRSEKIDSVAVQYEHGLWIPKSAYRTLRGLRRLVV